jgi:hypothetical protein
MLSVNDFEKLRDMLVSFRVEIVGICGWRSRHRLSRPHLLLLTLKRLTLLYLIVYSDFAYQSVTCNAAAVWIATASAAPRDDPGLF